MRKSALVAIVFATGFSLISNQSNVDAQSNPVPTRWITWGSGNARPPDNAVVIGRDLGNGGNREIYVCRAKVGGSGWIPGKLVGRRCNVPWNAREYPQDAYDVLIGNMGCFGWPNSSRVWQAADDTASPRRTVCRVHYLADRGLHVGGPAQDDNGMQGGMLVENNSCRFGWDGHVKQVVRAEVYYPTCPAAIQHSPTPTPSHQDDPHIAAATIAPSEITAGQQSTLTVTLTQPAPAGGFVVGISHITNTGVDDVIEQMPVSLSFQAGATSFPFVITTRHRTNDVTDIVFKAFHYSDEKYVEIKINP